MLETNGSRLNMRIILIKYWYGGNLPYNYSCINLYLIINIFEKTSNNLNLNIKIKLHLS